MIFDNVPHDQIQGEGHGSLKCVKLLISKAISSANMHVIKRLMVNYDTPRQHLHFNWTDFYICPHWVSHDLQTWVFHLWQMNFFMSSGPAILYGAYFI